MRSLVQVLGQPSVVAIEIFPLFSKWQWDDCNTICDWWSLFIGVDMFKGPEGNKLASLVHRAMLELEEQQCIERSKTDYTKYTLVVKNFLEPSHYQKILLKKSLSGRLISDLIHNEWEEEKKKEKHGDVATTLKGTL